MYKTIYDINQRDDSSDAKQYIIFILTESLTNHCQEFNVTDEYKITQANTMVYMVYIHDIIYCSSMLFIMFCQCLT